MGYRSNVVFYIASPRRHHYQKILEEILNVSYQNESRILQIIAEQSVSKIIKKDDYDCLRGDEYVLIFTHDWIKIPDNVENDIGDLIDILEFEEIMFSLEYLEIGEDFHDVKTYCHNNNLQDSDKTDDNCKPSFLNNNTLDVIREIMCHNSILNEYLNLGDTNGRK